MFKSMFVFQGLVHLEFVTITNILIWFVWQHNIWIAKDAKMLASVRKLKFCLQFLFVENLGITN